MSICCCCKSDEEPQKGNESVVVVNNDDGSAIINQPTNKSANSSFKFNKSTYSQSNGFINDAVEFDEIDLNERKGSQRSRDQFQNNNSIKKPANTPSSPPEDTINVTGLMLDQLYDEDEQKEVVNKKIENNNDDHLSREIIEEYDVDPNVITDATEEDLQQISEPTLSLHRLTINLEDDSSNGLTASELVSDPTPAPRSNLSSSPPPLPLISPPQWSPMENELNSPTVYETQKCPFELGTDHMDDCSKDHKIFDEIIEESLPTTSNLEDEPPYPANPANPSNSTTLSDLSTQNNHIEHPKLEIQYPVEQNRMYGGFSTSSSDTNSDEEENNDFELDSLQTTDRQQPAKTEYSVLSNEETDKSNAG